MPELFSRNGRTCARPSSKCESWKPSRSSTFSFATMHVLEGAYWRTVSANVTYCCCILWLPQIWYQTFTERAVSLLFLTGLSYRSFSFLKKFFLLFIYCCTGSHCSGLSCWGTQDLGHLGSGVAAPGLQGTDLVLVERVLNCSTACGIFLDQGSNQPTFPCTLDSLLLDHQGSPMFMFLLSQFSSLFLLYSTQLKKNFF